VTADPTFWNRIAEKYARTPVTDPEAFERKIAVMKTRMTPTDTVLDVGCGTGSLALRLAPFAAHVHGLDLSPEMVRIARGKAAGVANVSFHTGAFDETFTTFADGSLHGLCACSILHLVEDRAATLAHMYRLLQPGGFLVTSTACLGESWVPYTPILRAMYWVGKAPQVWVFSKQTLIDEIRAAGFVDIESPDVGAKAELGFIVARVPLTSARGSADT
jgi:arsenite methyltransferase